MSGLRVYSTSVTGSREIKSQQSEVTRILVNGNHYCGDYELFVEAVEQNTLQEFLKLA